MIHYNLYFVDLTAPYTGAVKFKCTSGETKRTRETNSANMAIAQMNNEYNEKLLDKQLNYNLEQWDRENSYNTPAAQADRLKQAGLNPALFMNGSSNTTGVGGSHLGITPMPASEANRQQIGNPGADQANMIQAFKNTSDSLMNFSVNQSAAELNSAQAKQVNVESKYTAAKAVADIANKISQTRDANSRAALNEILHDLKQSTFSDDVRAASLGNDATQAQIDATRAQETYIGTMTQLNEKDLEYFDQKAIADLSLKASQIVKNHADAKLARQMVKTEVEKAANLSADTKGKKLDNNIIEKTTDALISSAQSAAEIKGNDAYVSSSSREGRAVNENSPQNPFQFIGRLKSYFTGSSY